MSGAGAALPGPGRILLLDLARSLALLGMAVFHFAFDLQMFGLIAPGTVQAAGWALFARLVAGSFLFLAGVSLWLAHGRGIRWRAFATRLARLAAAAALITLATWIAIPEAFIFYGILQSIAVASVIGLAFLGLPAAVTLAVAAGVFVLPRVYSHEVFGAPGLVWLGLAPKPPVSMDFEPLFPWLAPCLAGLAAARIAARAGLWDRLRGPAPSGLWAALAWPGRHSLAVYLIHQPLLFALVWIWTRFA